jgi:hypothetical protein
MESKERDRAEQNRVDYIVELEWNGSMLMLKPFNLNGPNQEQTN